VILQGTSLETTIEIAERLRMSVEATPLRNQKTGINYGPITLSLGICMASDAESAEELYNKADVALYTAKHSGRNRSQLYKPELNQEFEKNWSIYKS
jgi:diguanylate cyclase